MTTEERYEEAWECTDEQGRRVLVHVYRTYTRFADISGAVTWAPGSKRLATVEGEHVNGTKDPEVFKTLETERVLRRVKGGAS